MCRELYNTQISEDTVHNQMDMLGVVHTQMPGDMYIKRCAALMLGDMLGVVHTRLLGDMQGVVHTRP